MCCGRRSRNRDRHCVCVLREGQPVALCVEEEGEEQRMAMSAATCGLPVVHEVGKRGS